MNKAKKEKWAEEVMAAAKSIVPQPSDPYLSSRVLYGAQNAGHGMDVSIKWSWALGVLLLMLAGTNLVVWTSSSVEMRMDSVNNLVSEYNLQSTGDLFSLPIQSPGK